MLLLFFMYTFVGFSFVLLLWNFVGFCLALGFKIHPHLRMTMDFY